jgi:iron complex outermembrane recepter protein
MTKSLKFGFRLAAGVAFVAFSPMAYAQAADDAADTGNNIVVTGQRQQYHGDVPLQDMPQAIQVIDNEILTRLNVVTLDSALELASGVSRQNNFGGLWDAYAVRGFAGDENFPSGFLVNGFNGGRGYGGPRDASNIDHIEVLKGPTAALFGRGEPGGSVNIITRKATLAGTKGSIAASAGSWNNYRGEADLNFVASDSIAIRVNGAYQDSDSFRDFNTIKKFTVSPSILVRLGDATSITYEAEYVNLKVPFDRGIVAVNGNPYVLPPERFLGEPGDGPTRVEVLGHQAQLQHDLGGNWTALLGFGYRDTSFSGFSSDAELALGRQILDNDGVNLSRQRRFRDYNTQHVVVRGELSGSVELAGMTHHLMLGADWDKFDIDTVQLRVRPPNYFAGSPITAANNAVNIFAPVYGQLPVPGAFQNQHEVQRAWGIYFQDQIDLTDQFKLRLGGRYDNFDQAITFRLTNTAGGQNKTKFSPTVGLVWETSDALTLYASWGRGFRPNSGTGFAPVGTTPQPFLPETSESYEIGAKFALMGGDIAGSLALYTMKKDNILTADPVNANFSIAIGEAKSKGVEFDLTAKLPSNFNLYLAYAYTDAHVSKDVFDINFVQPIRAGDPLINIPKHTGNAILIKDFPLGDESKASLGAGINFATRRLGETATRFFLPGYVLVKVLAAYEPTKNLRISADVSNVFNRRWFASSYAQVWIAPGTPRSFNVKAAYSF